MTRELSTRLFSPGGEMGELMRSVDWSRTGLGPVEDWPFSLRTAVGIVLGSRFPMLLWWGPDLLQLYNDAYRPILGDKHPQSLGAPGAQVWSEVWNILGPLAEGVQRGGPATWNERLLLPMDRKGFREETYFTFSYSPVPDDQGGVGGVLVTCQETTSEVLGERRLITLQQISGEASNAKSVRAAALRAMRSLRANPHDLPFASLCLVEPDGVVRETFCSGEEDPARSVARWPLAELAARDQPIELGTLPPAPLPYPEQAAPTRALVVAVRGGSDGPTLAYLVAGLSANLEWDERYQGFLSLVAAHLGRALANARAYEEESRRVEVLREAMNEARAADQRKDEFLAMLAHELRNPLAAISMSLSRMDPAEGDPQRAQKHREVARRQMTNLVRLVDDLLDVSRLSRGRIELRKTPQELVEIVQNAVSATRGMIDQRRHALTLGIGAGPFRVLGDPTRLEQVVTNLLTNAAKYTEPGGAIRVSLARESGPTGSWAVLTVKDSGRGIPPQMLDRVFELFVQVDATLERSSGGLGLGLTVVQRLVALHGGTVEALSRGTGQGAEFVVRLPLQAEAAATDQAPVPAPQPVSAVSPRRILVVEDSDDIRTTLQEILEDLGHQVEVAADGVQGAQMLAARPPDLAFVDVGLPGLDGYEVARRGRAAPGGDRPFLVALTGYGGAEDRQRAQQAGFDLHLTKPLDVDDLPAVLRMSRPTDR